jgi:RND family efflux transporter MFP subunit
MSSLTLTNKVLPLLIITLAGVCGYFILTSGEQKPSGHYKSEINRLRTVQISTLEQGSVVPSWKTSGFVIPAESIKISPRVSGNIQSINALASPGALFRKGQWLAKIETIDFELALKLQQAELEQAKANLSLELANQTLAQEELLLLNNDNLGIDQSLVLREPQLTVAKAKVSVARVNLEKAALDLARTTVIMPFDGKIINKSIGHGSKVSTNTALFSVVNTDVYWLEVKIPHKFLAILDKKQFADVSQTRLWGEDKSRKANFISILPELDNKDRQVKVLLAIDAPQKTSLRQPQVFINDFLNVQLKGKPIVNAWTIKHSWLQSDNTIWVVDDNNSLQKRAVTVLFKGRDVIYGDIEIQDGDRALAEKPGIASEGLVVRIRNNLSKSLEKIDQPKQGNTELKQLSKAEEKAKKERGVTHAG